MFQLSLDLLQKHATGFRIVAVFLSLLLGLSIILRSSDDNLYNYLVNVKIIQQQNASITLWECVVCFCFITQIFVSIVPFISILRSYLNKSWESLFIAMFFILGLYLVDSSSLAAIIVLLSLMLYMAHWLFADNGSDRNWIKSNFVLKSDVERIALNARNPVLGDKLRNVISEHEENQKNIFIDRNISISLLFFAIADWLVKPKNIENFQPLTLQLYNATESNYILHAIQTVAFVVFTVFVFARAVNDRQYSSSILKSNLPDEFFEELDRTNKYR